MYLNKSALLCATLCLVMIGCDEKNDAMEEFRKVPVSHFQGGAKLADGQSVQYSISSNDEVFKVAIEVRNDKGCFRGTGEMPVARVGGYDSSGQHHQFSGMKAQIGPKEKIPEYFDDSYKFLHLMLDEEIKATSCSQAISVPEIPAKKSQEILSQHLFSSFGLSEKHLALAGPVLSHGSSHVMYFFKEQDLGLIFDSSSMELIGISIPKNNLTTGYQFATNIRLLKTDKIKSSGPYPLLIKEEDSAIYYHAASIAKAMNNALKLVEGDSKEDRDFVVYGTWIEIFNQQRGKK